MDVGDQEWHEDPLPGLGVQEVVSDDSTSDSDSDSDSESKPGNILNSQYLYLEALKLLICKYRISTLSEVFIQ